MTRSPVRVLRGFGVLGVLVGALAATACTQQQSVLALAEVTDCATAFLAAPNTPCDLDAVCKRPSPTDPMCCQETAYCGTNGLVVDKSCNPDCATCMDDTGCTPGAAICTMNTCTGCPPTTNCPPCPMGWAPLTRNGCETCDCAPVSQCLKPDPNDPGDPMNGCMPPDVCYPGARCAFGCAPSDVDCCANVCAPPGCMGPAPLGCLKACDPMTTPNCMQCAADACTCTNGVWQCTERCVDGSNVAATCIAP